MHDVENLKQNTAAAQLYQLDIWSHVSILQYSYNIEC